VAVVSPALAAVELRQEQDRTFEAPPEVRTIKRRK
jgi:hypothetical protein